MAFPQHGQANASIKQTYPLCSGSAGSGDGAILGSDTAILGDMVLGSDSSGGSQICEGAFGQANALISKTQSVHGQAQAYIKATIRVHGQAQSDIKATVRVHGQAQADIKQTYNVHGQSQGQIVKTSFAYGQAQAKINAFGVARHGQANADIKQTYPLCVGSGGSGDGALLGSDTAILGDMILGSSSEGGSQTCEGAFGQAQAFIQAAKNVHGQSQADIKQTYYVHGQAQAKIKQTYNQHGQAQGDIKQTYYVHGQTQARIKNTYRGHGQAQGYIAAAASTAYLIDTFSRTRAFDTGLGTPDVGPTWQHPAPADDREARVNGQTLEIHSGDGWAFGYIQAYSDLNINNFDYFVDFRIETHSSRVYSFVLLSPVNIPDPTGLYMSNVNEWTLYDKSSPDAVVNFTTNANTWYRIRFQLQGGNVRFKIWDINDPQPTAWLAELNNATTLSSDIQFYMDEGFGDSARLLTDNVYVAPYSANTTQYMAGQAQAYIIKSQGLGQAAGAISSPIKQAWGQAQAHISPQYAVLDDSYHRIVYLTDGGSIGAPDKGEYLWFFSSDRGVVSFNNRLEYLPFVDGGTARELDIGAFLDTGSVTSFIEFHSDSYVNPFIETFIGTLDFSEYVDFYYDDTGTLNLITSGGFTDTSFTIVNDTTYRMMVQIDGPNAVAKAKMWDASGVEPDWMLQRAITPGTIFSFVEFFPQYEVSNVTHESYVPRLWVYSSDVPGHLRFGQARAVIITPTKWQHGQARARIKATTNRHGQARAFIRKSAGYGQAQALITKTVYRHGQAQAMIFTPGRMHAQAQAQITTTTPNGQAQAWIKNTWFPTGQAAARILQKQWAMGQAQAQITAFGFNVSGQAQALITGAIKNAYGQAMAKISATSMAYGQAQATIGSKSSGQAQAQIKRANRSHGQALGMIKRANRSHGQAQAYIQGGTVTSAHGQAQAFIEFQHYGMGQAQAMIRKGAGHGQAQARIVAFGQAGFGNAQGFIRRTDTNFASGQSAGQIKRNDFTGQAQALIVGGRYLVKYNGYHLPGYAQVEDYDSTEGIYDDDVSYQDGPFSEYTGLKNKNIVIDMTVIGATYLDVKNQVQEAATIAHSAKTWTKLYIQRYDRYYIALNEKIQTQKVVGSSMRFLTYGLTFVAKPWLESNTVNVISGTGTIDTGTRSLDNGGWTPATVKISGTDVTVSGYTAAGDFTGFISVSGTVTDMIIDSEDYTTTIGGVNSENQMYNPDYALFVGPGQTFFEINGATSVEIQYRDRWYL